eukprot:GHVS01056276.1.p1 GENE.GHVS01056276.1~~GHVS01056276.1.p1  ORF type:complete len:355 (+),score=71.54 GHVS01056276.1:714-1778(+)
MAPKKDPKSEKGQVKAEQKQKVKAVDDKTFGLKNKNKSKTVQKFIKGLASSVAGGQGKGGESGLTAVKLAEKDEKKKSAQQAALLASLFKGTENVKQIAIEEGKLYDPKGSRVEQKINLYEDQREQKDEMENWDITRLEAVIAAKHSESNANSTDIVCKHFVDAVEKKQYGWFWNCPNGGDNCKYRHCLPPGYVLKASADEEEDEEDEELFEDKIERMRLALPPGGTPVTLATLTAWRENKETERMRALEETRVAEAKRTGGRGLHVLTGKDLFAYDPSLFVDDEGAAGEDDYNEDEDWEATVAANQQTLDSANAPAPEQLPEKREAAGAINENLFLAADDDELLPDYLDDLDD